MWVGESPGDEETKNRIPFCPTNDKFQNAGTLFTNIISRNGIPRESARIFNLSQYQPYHNNFELLRTSDELKSGIEEIKESISKHPPNVLIPLGNEPLYYLTGKHGIWNWRGSILTAEHIGFPNVKVIPAFHPSYVNRMRKWYPVFNLDVKRISSDSQFTELRLPVRESIILNDTSDRLDEWTQKLLDAPYLSVDIETWGTELACIGFSPSPDTGVCIFNSTSPRIIDTYRILLQSRVPKVFHFGTFDTTYLVWKGWTVNAFCFDTFIAQRVLEPEFPRSLAYLTSEHTREPYYKPELKEAMGDIKSWNRKVGLEKLAGYNIKDVCVTAEIYEKQSEEIKNDEDHRKVFAMDMELVEVASDISRNGMLVDEPRRLQLHNACMNEWATYQSTLNKLLGHNAVTVPLLEAIQKTRKGTTDYKKLMKLYGPNPNSNKQVKKLLYDELQLPKKYKKTKGDIKETADNDALISLLTHCKGEMEKYKSDEKKHIWTKNYLVVKHITLVREVRKKLSGYIDAEVGEDGRTRGLYKLAAETGRWACEMYIDGTGFNQQTMPRDKVKVA